MKFIQIIMNRLFFSALLIILLAGNLYTISRYLSVQKELSVAQQIANDRITNDKVLSFDRLFIEKVLNAKGEVSFNDRLQLENAVRDLHDDAILTAWNAFVNSKTQQDAQDAVRSILTILATKIRY